MSLSRDGTWKGGVWNPSVWADGVWFEIAVLGSGHKKSKKKRHKKQSLPDELVTAAPSTPAPFIPIHEPDEDDAILLIALQRILH